MIRGAMNESSQASSAGVSATNISSDAQPLPGRWTALTVLALAQFVLVLDSTVVNVALPSIQRQFDLPEARLAWIVNGYGLTFGGLLLLGGSLGDLYGRRKLFMIGIATFSGASFIAGLAWNADVVIAMRFLQGAGAAMAAPAALSSITRIFTIPKERTRALGTWGGISALGGTIGAVLSGFIVQYSSWRWVFFVTVPITLIALLLATRFVPESRAPSRPKLDVIGSILITLGIGTAVFALLNKGSKSWTSPQLVGELALAAILIVVFVLWEKRQTMPMVPLDIFKNRNRVVGVTASVLFGSVLSTYFFTTTLYMQVILRFSPLKTGAAYLPLGLVILFSFPIISALVPKVGIRLIMPLGLISGFLGLLKLSQLSVGGTYPTDVLPGMLLVAFAAACGFVTFTIAGVDGTTEENAGIASGILSAGGQIGSALGLATLVSIAVSVSATKSANGTPFPVATVAGFSAAYHVAAFVLLVGAIIAATFLRSAAKNTAAMQPKETNVDVPESDSVNQ
ncbi:unannotated protein [freshwater metagenome]|uniref:Unannotated protein n=1 Tax=freshwater metagenome TaxID=449393 RepID=A0A6J7E399_9ZZZZ|nr:MFS transporter [Actinomycetota bacterium]